MPNPHALHHPLHVAARHLDQLEEWLLELRRLLADDPDPTLQRPAREALYHARALQQMHTRFGWPATDVRVPAPLGSRSRR